MNTKQVERNEEIRRYRWVSGWTLQKIGDRFGISRERVRQVLEENNWGTGGKLFVGERTRKKVLDFPHLTNKEAGKILGLSESSISDHRKGTWHKRAFHNISRWELHISNKLNELGIHHELTDHMLGYNILVYPETRVKIILINKQWESPSQSSIRSPRWKARVADMSQSDFHIIAIDPLDTVFVFPNHVLPSCQLGFCWPIKNRKSKWAEYHENYDLLKGNRI